VRSRELRLARHDNDRSSRSGLVKTISCNAPYGNGGLGRHLEELVEDARTAGTLAKYYTTRPKAGDPAGVPVNDPWAPRLSRWTPIRFSHGWRAYLGFDRFDRAVGLTIEPAESHIGFSLQSLHTFRAARTAGCQRLELVSPTSHIDAVWKRHQAACRAYPIERTWLNERQRRKALLEYEAADKIIIATDYARDSFLEEGFPIEKLSRFDLTAAQRFRPADDPPPRDDIFRAVYVGSLSVNKGVPLLLTAFSSFTPRQAELTLVGGWGSRGMRRYLAECCARDPRIRIAPGDPLPHLQRADVYIHPSYEDGWAYAAVEALACGVPAVVTEDTGAKELIVDGVNGLVIPTGSPEAITEALNMFYFRSAGSDTRQPT
jgi:glycosyltransferase involved in cell wall biosynthesis